MTQEIVENDNKENKEQEEIINDYIKFVFNQTIENTKENEQLEE